MGQGYYVRLPHCTSLPNLKRVPGGLQLLHLHHPDWADQAPLPGSYCCLLPGKGIESFSRCIAEENKLERTNSIIFLEFRACQWATMSPLKSFPSMQEDVAPSQSTAGMTRRNSRGDRICQLPSAHAVQLNSLVRVSRNQNACVYEVHLTC